MEIKQYSIGQACLKLYIGGYEISIAFDNNHGNSPVMYTHSLRIFSIKSPEDDVTKECFGDQATSYGNCAEVCFSDADDLLKAMLWCKEQQERTN